jgi:radical SAM superfamily enzyme YgiQ (UPF0313 family)
MVDLFHASRGCRFSCYPCAVTYLGGRKFRPRPVHKAIEELETIENNRLFIVDNSLAQDAEWEKELFKAMIPLKKKWISHTIEDKPEILDLAAQAGAWYVYQAVSIHRIILNNALNVITTMALALKGPFFLA